MESASGTRSICSPTAVNVTQNTLVAESAEFALEQLNCMQLLTCLTGTGSPILQITSIINATEQVVAGMITVVSLQATATDWM